MAGTVKTQPVYTVRCTCGAAAVVEVQSFGKPLPCKECHDSFKVVWAIDPKTRKKVPVTLPQTSHLTDQTPKPFRIPPGTEELICACGQHLLAKPEQAGKKVQCPVCARWMKLERYQDPQTRETRIREVDPRGRQGEPGTPAGPQGSAPLQDILCTCGEVLRVFQEHLGKQAQCPSCGSLMRLEPVQDPHTRATTVHARIIGRVSKPQSGDTEAWSLDDFV